MAHIRTIKPDFFTSGDIVSLTPLARLFYVSLWCEADREGRLKWNLRTLKIRYFPADDCNMQSLADELLSTGLIHLYVVDGVEYATIPSFTDHQSINNKERASVLPSAPFTKEKEGKRTKEKDTSKTRESGVKDALSLIGREGKGKEGKSYDTSGEDEGSDPFSEFWAEFPKYANRSNKAEAATVFGKLSADEQSQSIVGLRQHKALYSARPDFSVSGWEFFKSAQSWLRKRCWEIEDDTPVGGYSNGLSQEAIERAAQLEWEFHHGS